MLIAENITKRFSGVTVLDKVSMELHAGKVNAIIGENGAGKSTLMKLLSGVYTDYEGRLLFNDKELRFRNTRDAQEAGIAIIHQELNLVPGLTIVENVFLGRELHNRIGMLDLKKMREEARKVLELLQLKVDPETPVGDLKVGQQQVVEIAKALLVNAQVIIMDEPSSAISEAEVQVLFGIIEKLRAEGKVIVYISHKLDELFRIADRYIVLRDGCCIESGDMQGKTTNDIIAKMVGRNLQVVSKSIGQQTGNPVLSVSKLNVPRKRLRDISFELYPGQVLGIFGLMGAGRTELLETLFGLHSKQQSGEMRISGTVISPNSPAAAVSAGLALVPEDRKQGGLVGGLDIKSNISVTVLKDLQQYGWIDTRKESALAEKYRASLGIKSNSILQPVQTLSGGNQQKVVLAKWLATEPKVLLLDEPTRGVDIGAKREIYQLIGELAKKGMGILVVSSEIPELLEITDRILVMCEGRITGDFDTAKSSEQVLLGAAIPKTN